MKRSLTLLALALMLGTAGPTPAFAKDPEPAPAPEAPSIMQMTFVGVTVPDIDAASTWYQDALGMAVVMDQSVDFGDGQSFRLLTLKFPNFDFPQLMLYKPQPEMEKAMGLRPYEPVENIYLMTNDVDGMLAAVKAKGATVIEEATDFPFGRDGMFADPWGNVFDITAPSPDTKAAMLQGLIRAHAVQ